MRAMSLLMMLVAHFIIAAAGAAGDDDLKDRCRAVADTAMNIAHGRKVTGLPTIAALVGEQVVARMREWLELPENFVVALGSRKSNSPRSFRSRFLPAPSPGLQSPGDRAGKRRRGDLCRPPEQQNL